MDVCIVGSVKFRSKFSEINSKLKKIGIVSTMPPMNIPKEKETPALVRELVYDTFKKIDKSEILYVVNPGGYVGNSVKVEIGYAKGLGKKVLFLEKNWFVRTRLPCRSDNKRKLSKKDHKAD
jgi:hypothetical protein